MNPKSSARTLERCVRFLMTRLFVGATKGLLIFSHSRIVLANNTTLKIDGTGAQIQRLLSIYALSEELGIRFLQNPFVDISVHPLDPFQTEESKAEFVTEMNDLFAVDQETISSVAKEFEVQVLTGWKLLKFTLLCLRTKHGIVVRVVEAYPITDCYPNIVLSIRDRFPKWTTYSDLLVRNYPRPLISIHYRQGAGGLALYPGQKIPRELPPSYFFSKLKSTFADADFNFPVHLFTDAPVNDLVYTPQAKQTAHWEGTPGFKDGQMQIKGNNLYQYFRSKQVDIKVHSGGNPLEAIALMSKSDLLITSRSSLSYVAGLLNSSGTIVAADQFWHPNPDAWITD